MSNSCALSNDARFTRRRPSESYDANVFHFVLHTSSLISLILGSVEVKSAQHCPREQWHSLQIICTNIVCLHHSLSHSFFPKCSLCSSALVAFLPVFSLSSFTSVFLSEISQCCKRKLVAMLISLFEALRASRASILEKPISTNIATCSSATGELFNRGGCVDGCVWACGWGCIWGRFCPLCLREGNNLVHCNNPDCGCCLVFRLASLYWASSSCWSSRSILCCLWMSRVAPIPRGVSLLGWEPWWTQMLITH